MWPIVLCSIVALAIIIRKTLQYRSALQCVTMGAQQICSRRPPLLVPLLDAVKRGDDEKELNTVGSRMVRNLEHGLDTLSLVSAITPLLGLTGTVIGMIQAFQVIADAGAGVNPGMLASGIWEALITTAAGLLVAIPAHVAHHYLDARLNDIVCNIQELASMLVMEPPCEV